MAFTILPVVVIRTCFSRVCVWGGIFAIVGFSKERQVSSCVCALAVRHVEWDPVVDRCSMVVLGGSRFPAAFHQPWRFANMAEWVCNMSLGFQSASPVSPSLHPTRPHQPIVQLGTQKFQALRPCRSGCRSVRLERCEFGSGRNICRLEQSILCGK